MTIVVALILVALIRPPDKCNLPDLGYLISRMEYNTARTTIDKYYIEERVKEDKKHCRGDGDWSSNSD